MEGLGERETPEADKPRGIEYRCGGALADLFVVAVKLLLDTVGVEPRGRVVRDCVGSINQTRWGVGGVG